MIRLQPSICLLVIGGALLGNARPSQEQKTEFFQQNILPTIDHFTRIEQLKLTNLIGTGRIPIARWSIDYVGDSDTPGLVRIQLTNQISLSVTVRGSNAVVSYYNNPNYRQVRVNPRGIVADDSPERAKFYGDLKNTLDEIDALKIACNFFRAAGHRPQYFLYPQIHQLGWGDPENNGQYIPLPFYEVTWLRDEGRNPEPGEVTFPRVIVLVSGLTRQIISYERLFLPVSGDFELPASVLPEDEFIKEVAFPAVQKFFQLPRLPFNQRLEIGDILNWDFHYAAGFTKRISANVLLQQKNRLYFTIDDNACRIISYVNGEVSPEAIALDESPIQAQKLMQETNHLTLATAQLLAEAFVSQTGCNLKTFNLWTSDQFVWGRWLDEPTNAIPLPFYTFTWVANKTESNREDSDRAAINVNISGITKKIISYQQTTVRVETEQQRIDRLRMQNMLPR